MVTSWSSARAIRTHSDVSRDHSSRRFGRTPVVSHQYLTSLVGPYTFGSIR